MPNVDADRNLIFGILALQMDFVTRDALIAGLNAWVLEKSRPLGRVLVNLGSLAEDERVLLEALVAKHLEKHRGDAEESLSAVGRTRAAPEGLADRVADPELRATLARIGGRADDDPERTRTYAAPPSEGDDPASRFRILREHAEGGLGRVYLAKDRELNRHVAIKRIRDERADYQGDRDRFVFEAEVTGGLEHPGIVPVYAMGRDPDGRPYYAMRFIQGEPLKAAIRRLHGEGEEGPMGLRRLVGRLVAVCNAVAYAHSRGILHRDIKPSNIMLGRYGETLLVDWGLAKAVGRPESGDTPFQEEELRPTWSGASGTLPGYPMGTPQYMSPEQALGRLGTVGMASDIYGLGATLYCVLAGRPPADAGPPGAEPTVPMAPGARSDADLDRPGIPRPLAAVVRKAMARRPEDRYPSALEMAADLERWLADEPVLAYREPIPARAGRWVRRHRTAVAAAGALLVASVVALAASNAIVRGERDAARQAESAAETARAREARARQEAETNLLLARQAADHMLTRVAEERLPDLPELGDLRKDLAREALRFARAFLKLKPESPSVREEAALTLRQVANIEQMTGDHAGSLAHFDEAEALYRGLILDFPEMFRYVDMLAQFLTDLAEPLRASGRAREAMARLDRAYAIAREQRDAHPGSPAARRTLAYVQSAYSQHLFKEGRDADALARADEAVGLFDALQSTREGGSPFDPLLLLMAMVERVPLQRESGREVEAVASLDRSIGLARSIVDRERIGTDARYYLAVALRERAAILAETRPAEAAPMLDESVRILDGLRKAAPRVRYYPPALAESRSVRAGVLAALGRLDQAGTDLDAAEGELAALVAKDPNDLEARILRDRNLARRADLAGRRGDRAGASSALDRAIEDADALAKAHPENARLRREADRLRGRRDRLAGAAKP